MEIKEIDNKINIVMNGYVLDDIDAYWTEKGKTVRVSQLENIYKSFDDDGATIHAQHNGRHIQWEIKNYGAYISSKLTVSSETELFVENICVLSAKLISLPQKFLRVPFDNDDWVKYEVKPYEEAETSYGVCALYGENGAMAIGAVDYDIWKTAIIPNERIEVFSGIADKLTRDTQQHGIVRGKTVSSPEIFILRRDTWQSAMSDFAVQYERHNSKLSWNEAAPFGWNSWYAYMDKIDDKKYLAASEFIKEHNFTNEGISYINFDSFWNKLTKQRLREVAQAVRNKGQRAGIYAAPFSCWVDDEHLDDAVTYDTGGEIRLEGFEGTTWRDVILKDKKGTILPRIDGGYPLDVSHPVVIERTREVMEFSSDAGYEYIKLDFLAHGAVEGERYDKTIMTGLMAYSLAMQYIISLSEKTKMFISLSIAPLFPGGCGHARRICCDVFEKLKDTKYLLNSLTYGFWQNKRVYEFTDPDHICFNGTYYEAKSRLLSAVIGGSIMLISNDIFDEPQNERIRELISNNELLDIARRHITFIPDDDEGAERDGFASMFVSEDKKYIAVFNLTDKERRFQIFTEKSVTDIMDAASDRISGGIYSLKAYDCALLSVIE